MFRIIILIRLYGNGYYILINNDALIFIGCISKDVERDVNAAIGYAKVFGIYHM